MVLGHTAWVVGSVAFAAASSGMEAAAQAKLSTWYGESPGSTFGYAVDGAGDIDRDGFADLIASGVDYGTFIGYVRVYSGRDGSTLMAIDESGNGSGLGSDVAGGGDADGDGWPDLIVGSYWDSVTLHYAGAARVYSGRDGSLLHTFTGWEPFCWFGLAVDWVGDVDQDGHDDLIVSGYQADDNGYDSGKAEVYSGRDGHVIHTFRGAQARDEFGRSVSGLGDVDGDGCPDILVGGYNSNTSDALGYVRVYSGRDGSVIRTHHGNLEAGFGQAVAELGDLDGDGRADYAVGGHLERSPSGHGTPVGAVRVFSGASGALLHTFWGAHHSSLGYSLAGPGDVDGDGVPDVAAGAPSVNSQIGDGRYVVVWSGADGHVLYRLQEGQGQFGIAVAGAGDTNGDGWMEVAATDYKNDDAGADAGVVYVLAGNCPAPETYCVAAPNSVGAGARIGMRGGPGIARNELALTANGAPPGETGLFFFGDQSAQLPFGGGWLCVGGAIHRIRPAFPLGGDGTTERRVDLQAPDSPIRPGSAWHFQLWYRDPTGPGSFNLSDGLRVHFCR